MYMTSWSWNKWSEILHRGQLIFFVLFKRRKYIIHYPGVTLYKVLITLILLLHNIVSFSIIDTKLIKSETFLELGLLFLFIRI